MEDCDFFLQRNFRFLARWRVYRRSPSCATYTIVNNRWKRTQRDLSGNLLKAASINGSTNSAPLAFHKHRQHSINFISAASPPALKNGSTSFIDSPKPRLSSSSTAFIPSIVLSSMQHACHLRSGSQCPLL